jgi:hypothetical protein
MPEFDNEEPTPEPMDKYRVEMRRAIASGIAPLIERLDKQEQLLAETRADQALPDRAELANAIAKLEAKAVVLEITIRHVDLFLTDKIARMQVLQHSEHNSSAGFAAELMESIQLALRNPPLCNECRSDGGAASATCATCHELRSLGGL